MSFDEIYKKYYRELMRFSRQLDHSSENCEDLVQETFMKYYLETGRNNLINNPRAWLYKVLLNTFRTKFVSDRKKQRIISDTENRDDLQHDLQTDYFTGEKQAIVLKVLDSMPDNVREILILYNYGFSYAEMAEILDINPASVGSTLVRAINKLREILTLHYHELFEQN